MTCKHYVAVALSLCLSLQLLTAAPQPLPRKGGKPPPVAGSYVLMFNGHPWDVTLSGGRELAGGAYRGVCRENGGVWVGTWESTEWPDVFAVCERPEGQGGGFNRFPVRFDGAELTIPMRGECEGRGASWGYPGWNYSGTRVSIRRAR